MSMFEINPEIAANLPRSVGVPRTFREQLSTSFDLAMVADRTAGRHWALQDEYQSLADEVHRRTGKRLSLTPTLDKTDANFSRQRAPSVVEQEAVDRGIFLERLNELRAQTPGLLDDLPGSADDVAGLVATKAQALEARRSQDLAVDPSLGSAGTDLLGTMGGVLLDPILLSTLFAGAPARAPLLAGMARESLIGAVAEAGLQIPVQQNRADLGLENGLEQALKNVAAVGVASPALYGLFRGAGIGLGKVRDILSDKSADLTPDERQLLSAIAEMDEATATVPVREPMGPEMRAHHRNLDQALLDLESGKVANVAKLDESELPDTLITATELRTSILRSARELDIDVSDEVAPGLTRAIEMTSDRFQAVLSRTRAEKLLTRMEQAAANERAVFERAIALEDTLGSLSGERARIQGEIQLLERAAAGERDAIDTLYSGAFGERPSIEALDALITNPQFKYRGKTKAINKRTNDIAKRLNDNKKRLGELDKDIPSLQTKRRHLGDEMSRVQKSKNKAGRQVSSRVDSLFSDQELQRIAAERDRAKLSQTMYYPLSERPTPREVENVEMAVEADAALARLEEKGVEIADSTIASVKQENGLNAIESDELRDAVKTLMDEIDSDEALGQELAACIAGSAASA